VVVIDGGLWPGAECAPTSVRQLFDADVRRGARGQLYAFVDRSPARTETYRIRKVQPEAWHEQMRGGCITCHGQKLLDPRANQAALPGYSAIIEEGIELEWRKSQHRAQKSGQFIFHRGPKGIFTDARCPFRRLEFS
jgi:hypothetical protein